MTDTEVANGAATNGAPKGEFPDLGAKSPQKDRQPKADFSRGGRDAGKGKKDGKRRADDRRPDVSDVTVDTPLVQPKKVDRPDESGINDKMSALRDKIDVEEKRVVMHPLPIAPIGIRGFRRSSQITRRF